LSSFFVIEIIKSWFWLSSFFFILNYISFWLFWTHLLNLRDVIRNCSCQHRGLFAQRVCKVFLFAYFGIFSQSNDLGNLQIEELLHELQSCLTWLILTWNLLFFNSLLTYLFYFVSSFFLFIFWVYLYFLNLLSLSFCIYMRTAFWSLMAPRHQGALHSVIAQSKC